MGSSSSSSDSSPHHFSAPTAEHLNSVIGAYEFIEKLGQGGMGAVYKARQSTLDRIVAIKVLPPVDETDEMRIAERFQREAKAMGRLSHPNIVSVFDFGQAEDGLLYIVMEFIEGTDLHQLIRTGELNEEHLLGWVPQICDALAYAHDAGIVHRDIKPANIMITTEGIVKVADFGLAKLTESESEMPQLTMTNMAMGTPDYVAPEALEAGVEPDHRADLYAVGVLIYEMLTGKVPRGAWKMPSQQIPGANQRYDELVSQALETDPEARYQSATEIRTTLYEIASDSSNAVPTADDSSNVGGVAQSKHSSRRRAVLIGSTLAILALAGTGWWLFSDHGSTSPETESAPALDNRNPEVIVEVSRGNTVRPSAEESATTVPSPGEPAVPETEPSSAPAGEPLNPVPLAETPSKEETREPLPPEPENEQSDPPRATPEQAGPGAVATAGGEPEKTAQPGTEVEVVMTETAVPVSTMPAESKAESEPGTVVESDPRLVELEAGFQAAFARTGEVPFEKEISALNKSFEAALNRARDAARTRGNLDEVTAIDEALERLATTGTVPEEDSETTPASLATLHQTYREARSNHERDRDSKSVPLYEKYLLALDAYEAELTRGNLIEKALQVREYRSTIEARLAKQTSATDFIAETQPTVPPLPVSKPPLGSSPDAPRKASAKNPEYKSSPELLEALVAVDAV
ncbi:MAG: protein kinase, partial [Verrucomicrobiota bacterium]